MKKFFVVFVLLLSVLLAACEGTVRPVNFDESGAPEVLCVKPESDNKYYWSSISCVEVNTRAYVVVVDVVDEITNHTEVNAESYGYGTMYGGYGYASSSMRMWQDGKGLLPVTIVTVNPPFHDLQVGDTIILKTTDLKAMAIPAGARATFVCNEDTEVVSPVKSNQTLTTDRITYELDDCRMLTPEYVLPVGVEE